MRVALLMAAIIGFSAASFPQVHNSGKPPEASSAFLGFDRNDYPGDANLKTLRETFAYSSYWLNNPPGSKTNSWTGKRKALQSTGFGFLVLFNGRTDAEIKDSEIKAGRDATQLGNSDADAAISAARAEGFPAHTVIFLDQEQGGRLLPEQRAYLHAWVDRIDAAHFSAGVYCSGIAAKESAGASVITAEDIRQNAGGRKIKYWVVNDSCPPSPGCAASRKDLSPELVPESSGIAFAEVWQFAQSPRRSHFAAACGNYDKDQNCYAPGLDPAQRLHLDLDLATSSDPSDGRTH
jgi:hypothetical protein